MKYTATNNREKHMKLTMWLVDKFNMSMDKAYDLAKKIVGQK